jgi:hypothetical protein
MNHTSIQYEQTDPVQLENLKKLGFKFSNGVCHWSDTCANYFCFESTVVSAASKSKKVNGSPEIFIDQMYERMNWNKVLVANLVENILEFENTVESVRVGQMLVTKESEFKELLLSILKNVPNHLYWAAKRLNPKGN